MSQREAFEAHMRERFGAHANLARSPDGYVSTVLHAVLPSTYASVQMLWEEWQAAIQHARDVADRIQTERAMKSPASDYLEGYNDGGHDCADAIKEALK